MPAENIDIMSEQNNNSPVEATVNLLPNPKTNMTDNCFKRPLIDKFVNSENIKKKKLVENDNFNLVMYKINKITVSKQNKVLNEQVNDSNEAVEDNRDNASVKIICDNDKIVDKDQEVNLAIKETICIEVSENTIRDNSVNSSNDHNICVTSNIPNNSHNDLNLDLNLSNSIPESISDKLVIVENSDHEISQLSELLDNNDLTKTKELNNKESKVKMNESEAENGLQLSMINSHEQNISETTIENITEVIEIYPDSYNDIVQEYVEYVDYNEDDLEIITSDILDDEDEILNVEMVNKTLNEIQNFNGKNFSYFLKLFEKSAMSFQQFDSHCTQKVIGILTEKCDMGELRSKLHLIQSREKYWLARLRALSEKIKELKYLVDLHKKELMIGNNARPQICKRSVGLQTCITTLKESNIVHVPKLSIQQSVDITDTTDDDKDDISDLDLVESIDLTESDDNLIDLTNTRNVEKSPIKIVKNQTINPCNISSGTSPQLTRNLSAQVVPTSGTFIEIPKLPTSSSSCAVSPVSSQLSTNLNPGSSSTAVKYVLVKDGRSLSIQIAPRTIKPAAFAYTAHQLPESSTVTRSLLSVSPAIPIYNHPAELPQRSAQRSLPNWKKIPPSPVLSIDHKPTDNQREIVLRWDMRLNNSIADISTYEIYSYHEINTNPPRQENWKRVGRINALPLPMACSLNNFTFGDNYHFAIRAVDIHTRVGPFSEPKSLFN